MSDPPVPPAGAGIGPKLVDGLYSEAMLLADEARSYFDGIARDDRLALAPADRVAFSCEALKVTTRLMQSIAWLLTQRALAAGEISRVQTRDAERRIGEAPESDQELIKRLPGPAAELIRASEDLYQRLRRLDEAGADTQEGASPARSLLNRLQRSL